MLCLYIKLKVLFIHQILVNVLIFLINEFQKYLVLWCLPRIPQMFNKLIFINNKTFNSVTEFMKRLNKKKGNK